MGAAPIFGANVAVFAGGGRVGTGLALRTSFAGRTVEKPIFKHLQSTIRKDKDVQVAITIDVRKGLPRFFLRFNAGEILIAIIQIPILTSEQIHITIMVDITRCIVPIIFVEQ